MQSRLRTALPAVALATAATAGGHAVDDAKIIAALDTEYQAAVERNDEATMARILHPDFVLVIGRGAVFTRQDLLDSTHVEPSRYEKQVEVPGTQTVRMFGDTGVVTALLWLKGTRADGVTRFDYKLWFSDTYVRTKAGWKYAFGQASIALPPDKP